MTTQRRERHDRAPRFLGCLDSVIDAVATGWALDRASTGAPTRVHVLIDGQEIDAVTCDGFRGDVQQHLNHPSGLVGFRYAIGHDWRDGMPHRLGLRFPDRTIVPSLGADGALIGHDWVEFTAKPPIRVRGFVDGLAQGFIRGWAISEDQRTGVLSGALTIGVFCDGVPMLQVRANRYRGDVAAAFGCDPNCGFQVAIPPEFRTAHAREFRFTVLPDDVELDNSPLRTGAVDDHLQHRLLAMTHRVEALHRELTALRRDIADIMPTPGHTLADYDRWAREYHVALRARVDAERALHANAPAPLVSVLLPTYRPLLSDFEAALDSVRAQTWQNWELLIVDDGSDDPVLTATIERAIAADRRIRLIGKGRRGGISRATNAALKAVRGEWIAFFDHDDLLAPVALEIMVREAGRTGARLLYSDEDKIDQAGFFLEPNLKPDWNHRYMLGCNYVCHLLFVAADVARAAGPLRPVYDGAQDHDFILRCAETIDAARIHHVPEILYHWRKTPNSTAVDVGRKDYAKQAGVQAVTDHLARLGRPATVGTVRGLTLYRVAWRFEQAPTVSIVIPFKDQAAITGRCIRAILERTDYPNFELRLIDNWSTSRETEALLADVSRDRRVRVRRVEERFNYSRLNNGAVADNPASLFCLMNNDVIVNDPRWLRQLVDETLADPAVAAVGGRLLYPNGTIQHAGVVVGLPGIAAHVHRGAPDGDYGFVGRIVLSHELSAVSAAMMLVRAADFRAVGGFDEVALTVAYNDVDLCLKLREHGRKIVYCADVIAEHHESFSRGSDDQPQHEARFFHETQTMVERWAHRLARDPHYSPHFTVDKQPFFDLRSPAAMSRPERPGPVSLPVRTAVPSIAPPSDERAHRPAAQNSARRQDKRASVRR